MIVFLSIIAVFGIYFIFTSTYYGYFSWFRPQEFLDKSDPLIKQKKMSYHFIPDVFDDMLINYFGNKNCIYGVAGWGLL